MVIMDPVERIEVALRNLKLVCSDMIYKNNKFMFQTNPQEYLNGKKAKLLDLALEIRNEEGRKRAKEKIELKFKEAEAFLWKNNDGKMFDQEGSDLT